VIQERSKHKELTDEELMQLLVKKDSEAFSELYDRYSEIALNFFFKMLWKDREKSEDFMQDLFMKLIHKPELYNTSKPFKTWFFSVANNMCKNEYRKAEVRLKAATEIQNSQNLTDSNYGEKQPDKALFLESLNKELEEMGQVRRSIFIMRFKHGFTIKEISQVLECSQGTVKSRIFYTVKNLNEKLKDFKNIALWLLFIALIN
jgi:RNA polymerase sigma-70 factor (ECF subfamily)